MLIDSFSSFVYIQSTKFSEITLTESAFIRIQSSRLEITESTQFTSIASTANSNYLIDIELYSSATINSSIFADS